MAATEQQPPAPTGGNADAAPDNGGDQRLSLERLKQWESLGYGMFIHFGMSTYDGAEFSSGELPASAYNPDQLDVDQWVQVARDAGMTYAVLTAKHVSGFCLWPTDHTDYHVGNSGNPTDVVQAFVDACNRHGLKPGLYYCSWDNRHRFGSETPGTTHWDRSFTTREYRDFQLRQMEELLTRYGPLEEVWIDIPNLLGHDGRREQYDQIARLQPDAVVMMNGGHGDGHDLRYNKVWPTDLITLERGHPSMRGYKPWRNVPRGAHQTAARPGIAEGYAEEPPARCYIPGEQCDTLGQEWFHTDDDRPRSDEDLLGTRLIARARGVNLLLDVGPDRSGLIPQPSVDALQRLRRLDEKLSA